MVLFRKKTRKPTMRIAVLYRLKMPHSIRIYTDNIIAHLERAGVRCGMFAPGESLPLGTDLCWDPGCSGGKPPSPALRNVEVPIIATVHDAAPMAALSSEYYPNALRACYGSLKNFKKRLGWRYFRTRCAGFITVSEFAKNEIITCLGLEDHKIEVIYHGVDHKIFYPVAESDINGKYFLHISQYQPIKNIDRIIKAHNLIKENTETDLVLVIAGFRGIIQEAGVSIISTAKSQADLADFYRGAMGFLYPSLRESFGMPPIEAMASGCPVITSNSSACGEIGSGGAILVDPRSVQDIAQAMSRVATDGDLRKDLRQRGLERAKEFTWSRAAELHIMAFEKALARMSVIG